MMHVDVALGLAGLLVGFMVGLTGMGGGALMTPILVLIFRVDPLTAVGSDLVVSLFMKPVGAGVHLRRGTIRRDIALWLTVGSVPAAFAGALTLRLIGTDHVEPLIKEALGLALLASAGSMLLRAGLGHRRAGGDAAAAEVTRLPTIAVGVLGGLLVGITSVGSGSLIIVLLMLLYPGLTSAELVGTDLIQAIPLVGSAALGHLFFGEVHLGLAGALLLGALPGVFAGAQFSSRASGRVVRPALFVVLLSSGLKLAQII
jgi:uncharacterized membrane protein YfcA